MKKAKFVLPAIGVLSVVAGALAFKAQHRFTGRLVCYTSATSNPKLTGRIYTTNASGAFSLLCTVPSAPDNGYELQKVSIKPE